MRIGIISTLENGIWGGCDLLWLRAAESAMAEGDDVAVSLSYGPETVRRVGGLEEDGAALFWRMGRRGIARRLKIKVITVLLNSNLAPIRYLGRWWRRRSSELRRFFAWKPDVVIVNLSEVYDCFRMSDLEPELEMSGVPYVTVTHVANDFQLPGDEMRRVTRSVQLGAKAALFVAVGTQRMVERHLACALPNGAIIRNPVNIDDCSLLPMPTSETAQFAFVGRLENLSKGLDLLFEVLGAERWQSREWQLTLYGDGYDREYLEDLASYYNIRDRVVFGGYSTNIRGVWEKAHMLVLPSRTESAPLALVEAMLCGRPSVVTDVGGVTEWAREQDTAFIAEATTVRSIGNAMERAWQARDKWEAMGMAAHEAARSRIDDSPGRTLIQIAKGCVSQRSS